MIDWPIVYERKRYKLQDNNKYLGLFGKNILAVIQSFTLRFTIWEKI